MPPPNTVRRVQKFLGVINFQRSFIEHFAKLSEPLVRLTTKDSTWRRGQLPDDALQAYNSLIKALVSAPCMAFPDPTKPYIISADASGGSDRHGDIPGIGAILSQPYPEGERNIAFFSRQLRGAEKSYSAIQLEKLACSAALQHFHPYVYHHPKGVILRTDHKPVVKHCEKTDKILSRLQEQIGTYGVTCQFRKGVLNHGPDYLSRNPLPVDAITQDSQRPLNREAFIEGQKADLFCQVMRHFLSTKELPKDKHMKRLAKEHCHRLCIKDDLLYHVEEKIGKQPKLRVVVPDKLVKDVIATAHGTVSSGHWGIQRTLAAIYEKFYWWSAANDVTTFIENCTTCRRVKDPKAVGMKEFLTPWEPVTARNLRIGFDLVGPFLSPADNNSNNNQKVTKYVLTVIDHYSGWTEFEILPNKTAEAVAKGLWKAWFCRWGPPAEAVHDGGAEFRNGLQAELWRLFNVKVTITSSRRPNTNGQCEKVHSPLRNYLQAFVSEDTLNWESYVCSFQYAQNTSINISSNFSPYYLVFGEEPVRPFHQPRQWSGKLNKDHEKFAQQLYESLNLARDAAVANRTKAQQRYTHYYNLRAKHREFKVGDRVLLHCTQPKVGANNKLLRPWRGPLRVEKILGHNNLLLRQEYSLFTTAVHKDRVRLFHHYNDYQNEDVEIITPKSTYMINGTQLHMENPLENSKKTHQIPSRESQQSKLPAHPPPPSSQGRAADAPNSSLFSHRPLALTSTTEEENESIFISPSDAATSADEGSSKRFRLRSRDPDHAQVPASAVKEHLSEAELPRPRRSLPPNSSSKESC